ncbi:hypothetical protein IE4872_PC00184 (plasmid) [Rhizobium gallicum]|uniref:Uncharacterized protein n=1 Tax=Rhizobium gallicum TaxID=56730 RepID=A0A1L5NQR7_9HYPH|nr:hypothetical protein IE4872_PC00184 [Rhizobium gallicum]
MREGRHSESSQRQREPGQVQAQEHRIREETIAGPGARFAARPQELNQNLLNLKEYLPVRT